MRLRLTVQDPASDGRWTCVTVSAPADAPAAEALDGVAGLFGGGTLWTTRPIDADGPLSATGLHDGELVALGAPAPPVRDAVRAGVELRVVGGPAAGMVVRLPTGRVVLGRHGSCDVAVPDPEMSREHAVLDVSADGAATIADLGSSNGTLLEGAPVPADPVALLPRQVVQTGATYLMLHPVEPPDGVLADDGECGYVFNRSYRIRQPWSPARIEFPAPPKEEEKASFPWLMMGAPLLVAVAMAAILKQPEYLILAVMGPVMTVGNVVHDRQGKRRHAARARAEHEQGSETATEQLRVAVTEERAKRRDDAPDPAALVLAATGPRGRLWERRPSDDDWLRLRVGLATRPSDVELVNHDAAPPAWAVPVVVQLTDAPVVGLAAPPATARALARALVLQAAVLHSPEELRLVLLTEPDAEDDWDWVRWLPHIQREGDRGTLAIGNDPETVALRVRELQQDIATGSDGGRAPAGAAGVRATGAAPLPHVLVVHDGARRLRSVPGMLAVLQQGPGAGIFSLCLDTTRGLLPEESSAVITWDEAAATATVEQHGHAAVTGVVIDRPAVSTCERAARALAPIHRVGSAGASAGLPPSARFLDVAGLDPPTADAVEARWSAPGRGPRALLGVAEHGPLVLDLATDGPHGLIAGTTGAGKSELLQTLVAGLAVALPPDELNVVLVDYKGGAAFKDCRLLPHTVGMVTDLDAHLTERALRSLQAELKRRERILAAAGAKDIGDYLEARRRSPGELPTMPRLVIVIDEFASLAVELPDFLKGLVGIAQRGRSLGVHLVLATQRPTGVVSPEIRANANFSIALRVVNTAESTDVIGTGDAAGISVTTPGRAFLRVAQEPVVGFQAARVGGRRPGAVDTTATVSVLPAPWRDLGRPDPGGPAPAAVDDDATDLHGLVATVCAAHEARDGRAQRQPWLHPLPDVLVLPELDDGEGESDGVAVAFGRIDLPDLQAQAPAWFDPAAGRHLLAAGSPRSGRSSLLLCLAGAAARRLRVDDVQLYALDCGRGSLLPLRDLPHCGVVVTRQETDRAERLLGRLADEVRRRQSALVELGLASAGEQRAAGGARTAAGTGTAVATGDAADAPWPYMVLLVDGWEGFLDVFHDHKDGAVEQQLLSLLRDGGPVGLTVVMTGDRSLIGTSRISSLFEDRYVLRFNDRDDYALADLSPRRMPQSVPAGRAFRAVTGEEVQIALLSDAVSGPAQAAAFADIAAVAQKRAAEEGVACRPLRVDALPTRITLRQAEAMESPKGDDASVPAARSHLGVLVGVGGDELRAWWADLAQLGPGFVVTGSPESGRSTALVTIAESLLDAGCGVVILTPRPSPLAWLAGREGVAALDGHAAQRPAAEGPAVIEHLRRSSDADAGGSRRGTGTLARPVAVLVDDAEAVDPDDEWLTAMASSAAGDAAVVVAGALEQLRDGFRGFPLHVKRQGSGLLLSPRSHLDASVFSGTLPRGAGFSGPPGRGYLFLRGRMAALLQVPLPG